jgi:hypothetical protein
MRKTKGGMTMPKFTPEQELEIIEQSTAAAARGDEEEAMRITQQMPLVPWLAKALKEIFGKEYLEGWDLSEAEAVYGKDWLNQ